MQLKFAKFLLRRTKFKPANKSKLILPYKKLARNDELFLNPAATSPPICATELFFLFAPAEAVEALH